MYYRYNTKKLRAGDPSEFSWFEVKRQPTGICSNCSICKKTQIILKQTLSGDSLPSRREIAAQLCVNPNTVQKAFKLMEDEGYVHTSGKLGSRVYFDEVIRAHIEKELTVEMVCHFIDSVKEIEMSFKQVIDRISELRDTR